MRHTRKLHNLKIKWVEILGSALFMGFGMVLLNTFGPKIFEYFGFIFYFFSNEHEPIHVHVALGDCETIFELIMENGELKEIRRRAKKGVDLLREKDATTAEEFIRKYQTNIIEKWINFFVLKKQIRCTNIKKKI